MASHYVQIVRTEDSEVVKTLKADSLREALTVERGVNINLSDAYHTEIVTAEEIDLYGGKLVLDGDEQ